VNKSQIGLPQFFQLGYHPFKNPYGLMVTLWNIKIALENHHDRQNHFYMMINNGPFIAMLRDPTVAKIALLM